MSRGIPLERYLVTAEVQEWDTPIGDFQVELRIPRQSGERFVACHYSRDAWFSSVIDVVKSPTQDESDAGLEGAPEDIPLNL